jgi:hypothetical protein
LNRDARGQQGLNLLRLPFRQAGTKTKPLIQLLICLATHRRILAGLAKFLNHDFVLIVGHFEPLYC